MKRVYTVFSFLLVALLVSGQYDPRENFYDAEFFFAEEDYEEALYSFTQVYKDGYQENANVNYRIGVCLLNIDSRKTEAIPYLEKAISSVNLKYKEGSFKEQNAPIDAHLYLGNAYRINYQIENAKKSYNIFLAYESLNPNQKSYAELQIIACDKLAIEAKEEYKQNFDAGTLGQINEVRVPVYNTTVSGDLQTLAFMGKHKFYNGVYISRKQDGKWMRPLNITPSIQSDGNQNVLSLSPDGNTMLVSWSDNFDSEIWMSEYKNGRWNVSEPIGKPINSKYYESHACFTPDMESIYFTSNRKESMGGMDIFRCDRKDDGTWSDLVLLGENVNTQLNEDYPFVSPDGKKLYFSSQGKDGLGGFDIYACNISANGSLGEPVNLQYPLNTSDDDFAYAPKEIAYNGYLTVYAKGSADQVDIFRFEYIPESAQPVEVAFEVPKMKKKDEILINEKPIEDTKVLADTKSDTDEASDDKAEKEVKEVKEVVVDKQQETVAAVKVKAERYLIKPVFFDFDSYALTGQTNEKLNDLASLLNKFPNLQLEISGHTDALGNVNYNKALSKRRAEAVSKYLNAKGIDQARLKLIPLGESSHIAINRTKDNKDAPKGRALNRRVQFSVKMIGDVLVEMEQISVPDNLKIN